MEIKSLKPALKYWQEIVFIIPIGILIIVMVLQVFTRSTSMFDDGLGMATFCFLSLLFILIFGQFFWKNEVLSYLLIMPSVLYSLFWIFASYAMPKDNPNANLRILIFIYALLSLFAAITMPLKYSKKEIVNTESF